MVIYGYDVRVYFLLFIVYAILGWCMEVIGKLIECKRFINRGFLIGPYCPIYGYGAILITFLLNRYSSDPIVLFVMGMVVCGILEYLTSCFMETIFKARWWDYSQRKFNINGRVCLNTIIPFGLLGMFIMYVSNPFFIEKIKIIPEKVINITFWSIIAIYMIDNIVSFIVIKYVSKSEKDLGKELDNTEEITKKVKEILQSKSILHRRLLNAYPNFEAVKIKIKQKKEEIKREMDNHKQMIKNKIGEIEEQTKKYSRKILDGQKWYKN